MHKRTRLTSMTGLRLLSASLVMLLVGCASAGSSSFTCPSPSTGMCSSVGTVDTMVKTGQLNNSSHQSGSDTQAASTNTSSGATGNFGNFSTPFPDSVITPGAPLRIQEEIMPIWIAPYQDKEGNYHDAATLYTIVHPGTWAGDPVPEVADVGGSL